MGAAKHHHDKAAAPLSAGRGIGMEEEPGGYQGEGDVAQPVIKHQ